MSVTREWTINKMAVHNAPGNYPSPTTPPAPLATIPIEWAPGQVRAPNGRNMMAITFLPEQMLPQGSTAPMPIPKAIGGRGRLTYIPTGTEGPLPSQG